MTIDRASVRDIEPFFISTYLRSGDSGRVADPGSLPTPLLDPHSLETAQLAYEQCAGRTADASQSGFAAVDAARTGEQDLELRDFW